MPVSKAAIALREHLVTLIRDITAIPLSRLSMGCFHPAGAEVCSRSRLTMSRRKLPRRPKDGKGARSPITTGPTKAEPREGRLATVVPPLQQYAELMRVGWPLKQEVFHSASQFE